MEEAPRWNFFKFPAFRVAVHIRVQYNSRVWICLLTAEGMTSVHPQQPKNQSSSRSSSSRLLFSGAGLEFQICARPGTTSRTHTRAPVVVALPASSSSARFWWSLMCPAGRQMMGGFICNRKKKEKEKFESSATISTTQPLLCVCGGLYKLWHKNVNGSLLRRGGTRIARESTSQQVNTKLSKTPKGGKEEEEEEHEKFQS